MSKKVKTFSTEEVFQFIKGHDIDCKETAKEITELIIRKTKFLLNDNSLKLSNEEIETIKAFSTLITVSIWRKYLKEKEKMKIEQNKKQDIHPVTIILETKGEVDIFTAFFQSRRIDDLVVEQNPYLDEDKIREFSNEIDSMLTDIRETKDID